MRAVAILGLVLCLGSGPLEAASRGSIPATTGAGANAARLSARLVAMRAMRGGCSGFMKDFPGAVGAYRASFERPLTITRGFGDSDAGVDVHILATNAAVDGTLKCRGEDFLRFELRIGIPPKDKAVADFDVFARAALIAALHWDQGKSETVVRAMSSDAAEYLHASEQRGDLYIAGKVEYHQADNLDLGLIWTQSDHTFVIASQTGQ